MNTAREAGAQDLRESGDVFDMENHPDADIERVLDVIGAERVARWLRQQPMPWQGPKEEE